MVLVVLALLLVVPSVVVGVGGFFLYEHERSRVDVDALAERQFGADTRIYDRSGRLMAIVPSENRRDPVRYDRISPWVKRAIVAIEDERFYTHSGVDARGILRAAYRNLREKRVAEGGSTITQQLIENLYSVRPGTDDRLDPTWQQKLDELFLAPQLEQRLTKPEILLLYLNNVYFGHRTIGVEAAAQTYFGRSADDLTIAQSALLAGLVQAPSAYDPFADRDAARARRDLVLDRMLALGQITPRQHERARASSVRLAKRSHYDTMRYPYYVAAVIGELTDRYGAEAVKQGGLRVHTALSPRLQRLADRTIKEGLGARDPAGAIVSVDPDNGEVLAMANSTTYARVRFNYATQGHRQPGSTFKPIVLAAALREADVDPSRVSYRSGTFSTVLPDGQTYTVNNFGGGGAGSRTLLDAMVHSDNTVFAQLTLDVGPSAVAATARRLGVRSDLRPHVPAIGLGGLRVGVTPLEMASAYATLADDGTYHRPTLVRRLTTADGTRVRLPRTTREALGRDKARRVVATLVANAERGTATGARLPGREIFAKTGTTETHRDAWLAGGTRDLATVVWMGYPQPRPMYGVQGVAQVTGGTIPARLWARYMRAAVRPMRRQALPRPVRPARGTRPDRWRHASGAGATPDVCALTGCPSR